MSFTLRKTTPADAATCARVVFDAFASIADRHNFPRDFPAMEMANGLADFFLNNPKILGMAAVESAGTPIGFNFLNTRNPIGGVGPMVVYPKSQGKGAGRALMRAIMQLGEGMRGVRLVQDAFNATSMSLYAALGFESREPLALVRGKLRSTPSADATVRAMTERDLDQCAALCERVHGFVRIAELRDAIASPFNKPHVLERGGRVAAYASAPWFWILNHGVARDDDDMRELLLGVSATTDQPIELLVPIREAALFRWLLAEGARVVKPMTLMTTGWYQEPASAYYPSVEY
jgi:GNAT superfamily N-acetyltransferase